MQSGYVLDFDNVINNLSIDYLVKQYGDNLSHAFSKIEHFTKQTLKKLIDHPNQLANAVDNANTYLNEHDTPSIMFINNDKLTGLVYPNSSTTYKTASDVLNIALINIIWSEYSAQFENSYPINESDFIQRLDLELSGIANLIELTNYNS